MNEFPPQFDTVVPEEAKEEMRRRGRGPARGCELTLREIGEILNEKGLSDRILKPYEVKRLLDSALNKVANQMQQEFKAFVDDQQA